MDTKSKIFLSIFLVAIFFSILATYSRMFIVKNYKISSEVECNPWEESCFVWHCLPDEPEGSEEACSGDPFEDLYYYKKITKLASAIEECNSMEVACPEMTCGPGEINCDVINCNQEYLEEGEVCINKDNVQEFEIGLMDFIDIEAYYDESEQEDDELESKTFPEKEIEKEEQGLKEPDQEVDEGKIDLDFIKTTIIKIQE